MKNKIGIIGAGSWGLALGTVLINNKNTVKFLTNEEDVCFKFNESRKCLKYTGDIYYNDASMTLCYDELLDFSNTLLISVPSHAINNVVENLKNKQLSELNLIIATKGFIDNELITDYLYNNLKHIKNLNIAILSGPSFSKYVLDKKVTCVVVSSLNQEYALKVLKYFNNDYFRIYLSNDIKGVQFCGAFKNAIALGAGIIEGSNQGLNARAALISRGLNEMKKFKDIYKMNENTIYGLAGVGDLVLTATDTTSRNYFLGVNLGRGLSIDESLKIVKTTAESIYTIKNLYNIAKCNKLDCPIIYTLYSIIYENMTIEKAIKELMSRSIKYDI
ncbi:MAG: NAD(P)H-dependent glycerol-3-phosphate dehydrogenase [Bacillales bacterium]